MVERASIEPAVADPRLEPRLDHGLTVEEAIQRTMLQHRNVFAALAESERRDREAEVSHANIRSALMR